MSAPITEAHKALWTTLYNLAHDEIFDVASSDGPAHKLLADSEARSVAEVKAQREVDFEVFHAIRMKLTAACGDPYKLHDEALDALIAERDQLRAELERLEECRRIDQQSAIRQAARSERAEAELAAAKERLRSEAMDDYASIKDLQRELATERARLDWLETPSGMDWQWEPERLTVSRAAIDAAMKEGA
jgi:hypothetical protein